MILRARRAHGSRRCAHDRRGFAIPRAVTVGARRPVDCILQHAGDRVVVFRRHKQDGVGLAYPTFELRDLGWRVLFLVLVKDGDAVQLESFENRAFRHQFGGRAQSRAIVGFAPQTAGDTENANWVTHVMWMLANSQRAPDESKNARAKPSSVFCRNRSLVARYPKTRRGVESCNWPEIAGNKQSTHPRLESFPVSTQHRPSRVRPILDQVFQRLLLREPPDACKSRLRLLQSKRFLRR